jgi:hypothetical protein
VKRLCADDSAATSVKVGYRQASYTQKPAQVILSGLFAFGDNKPRFATPDVAFFISIVLL